MQTRKVLVGSGAALSIFSIFLLQSGCLFRSSTKSDIFAETSSPPIAREDAFSIVDWSAIDLSELTTPEARAAISNACEQSIAWLGSGYAPENIVFGKHVVPRAKMIESHQEFLGLVKNFVDKSSFLAAVQTKFTLMRSVGRDNGKTLFTGYYVESLDGSLTKVDGYTPIYGLPKDLVEGKVESFSNSRNGKILSGTVRWEESRKIWLYEPVANVGEQSSIVKADLALFPDGAKTLRGHVVGNNLVPYWSRAQIAAGALQGRGLEIAWARNPVDLFFTEIQGTGILHLPDDSKLTIHYANQNGHKYNAIGKLLRDEGHLPPDGVTMQSIYNWLMAHPNEQQRVFNYNPSVVFFEMISGGVQGYKDLVLTPQRSLAADLDYFPQAALGFIDLPKPKLNSDGSVGEDGRISRFGFFQDTGGAIRGPGRIDIFWGDGEAAKSMAGYTQHEGNVYIVAPGKIGANAQSL